MIHTNKFLKILAVLLAIAANNAFARVKYQYPTNFPFYPTAMCFHSWEYHNSYQNNAVDGKGFTDYNDGSFVADWNGTAWVYNAEKSGPMMQPTMFAEMEKMNVKWASQHVATFWANLEKTKGNWTWDPADRLYNAINNSSVQQMGELSQPPSWASVDPADSWGRAVAADKMDDWYNYCYQMAKRYPKIRIWRVFHEMDNRDGRRYIGSIYSYMRMLKYANDAVKAVDPTILISTGDMAKPTGNSGGTWNNGEVYWAGGDNSWCDEDYLNKMIYNALTYGNRSDFDTRHLPGGRGPSTDFKKYADIISFNSYSYTSSGTYFSATGMSRSLNYIEGTLNKYGYQVGKDFAIWLNETGVFDIKNGYNQAKAWPYFLRDLYYWSARDGRLDWIEIFHFDPMWHENLGDPRTLGCYFVNFDWNNNITYRPGFYAYQKLNMTKFDFNVDYFIENKTDGEYYQRGWQLANWGSWSQTGGNIVGTANSSSAMGIRDLFLSTSKKSPMYNFKVGIRMKVSAGTKGKFQWDPNLQLDSYTFPSTHQIEFNLIADNQWHNYVLDLNAHPAWTNAVSAIRLFPTDSASMANVEVDFINFYSHDDIIDDDTTTVHLREDFILKTSKWVTNNAYLALSNSLEAPEFAVIRPTTGTAGFIEYNLGSVDFGKEVNVQTYISGLESSQQWAMEMSCQGTAYTPLVANSSYIGFTNLNATSILGWSGDKADVKIKIISTGTVGKAVFVDWIKVLTHENGGYTTSGIPTITYPTENSLIRIEDLKLTWNRPAGSENFSVMVSLSPDFNDKTTLSILDTVQGTNYLFPGRMTDKFIYGTTIYAKVASLKDGTLFSSGYSPVRSFRVDNYVPQDFNLNEDFEAHTAWTASNATKATVNSAAAGEYVSIAPTTGTKGMIYRNVGTLNFDNEVNIQILVTKLSAGHQWGIKLNCDGYNETTVIMNSAFVGLTNLNASALTGWTGVQNNVTVNIYSLGTAGNTVIVDNIKVINQENGGFSLSGKPTTISAPGGVVSKGNVWFNWNAVPGVYSYSIMYSLTNTFEPSKTISIIGGVNATSVKAATSFDNLLFPNFQIYWKVAAIRSPGIFSSEFSDVRVSTVESVDFDDFTSISTRYQYNTVTATTSNGLEGPEYLRIRPNTALNYGKAFKSIGDNINISDLRIEINVGALTTNYLGVKQNWGLKLSSTSPGRAETTVVADNKRLGYTNIRVRDAISTASWPNGTYSGVQIHFYSAGTNAAAVILDSIKVTTQPSTWSGVNFYTNVPVPTFPANNSLVFKNNLTLKWNPVSGAYKYGLLYSTSPDFVAGKTISRMDEIFEAEHKIVDVFKNTLTNGSKVYWKLYACRTNGAFSSKMSDTQVFTITEPTSVPPILTMNTNVYIKSNTYTLKAQSVNGEAPFTYSWSFSNTSLTLSFSPTNSSNTTVTAGTNEEGSATIYTRIIDYAGRTNTKAINFVIDKTPPIVSAGSAMFNRVGEHSAIVVDTLSGVDSVVWSKQSGYGTVTFVSNTSPVTLMSANIDGLYTNKITVKDRAGNTTIGYMPFIWDATPPVVDAGKDIMVSSTTELVGNTSDNFTGVVSNLWTQISGPATMSIGFPTNTVTPIWAPAVGYYKLRLSSFDLAGNVGYDDILVTWVNPGEGKTFSLNPEFVMINNGKNSLTIYSYKGVDATSEVSYLLYNNEGKLVRTLTETDGVNPFTKTGTWDGRNSAGYKYKGLLFVVITVDGMRVEGGKLKLVVLDANE